MTLHLFDNKHLQSCMCVTGSLIIAEYCLFVCSRQVVRILEFLHGRCDVNFQFNKQARNIKLLFNHI